MNANLVAQSARVSVSTVSRVINNPASVSADKVELVRKAMTELGYIPLPVGERRGPRVGRKMERKKNVPTRIGFWCIGTPEAKVRTMFSSQLEALHFAIADAGLEVKLLFSGADEIPADLLDGSLSGFLLQGLQPTAAVMAKLSKVPHIWLMTRRSEDYIGHYIEPDNGTNGRLAANWFASKKAQRWVYLTTEPDYPAYVQRAAAFQQRALELGLKVECITGAADTGTHQSSNTPGENDMVDLVRRFRALSPGADAVYIPGDGPCGPFFRELRRQGGNPADFSTVIGHYNPQVYESLDPQPVAIDINLKAIVEHAVRQLADLIKHPDRHKVPVGLRVAPRIRS